MIVVIFQTESRRTAVMAVTCNILVLVLTTVKLKWTSLVMPSFFALNCKFCLSHVETSKFLNVEMLLNNTECAQTCWWRDSCRESDCFRLH